MSTFFALYFDSLRFDLWQLKAAEGAQYTTEQAIKLEMELVEMKAERTVMSLRVKYSCGLPLSLLLVPSRIEKCSKITNWVKLITFDWGWLVQCHQLVLQSYVLLDPMIFIVIIFFFYVKRFLLHGVILSLN